MLRNHAEDGVIYESQTSTEDSALVTGGFLREKTHRFGLHFL